MNPRHSYALASFLNQVQNDFTIFDDNLLPVFGVNIKNSDIYICANLIGESFDLNINIPEDKVYNLHFMLDRSNVNLIGNVRLNHLTIHGGSAEICANSRIFSQLVNITGTAMVNYGRLTGDTLLQKGGSFANHGYLKKFFINLQDTSTIIHGDKSETYTKNYSATCQEFNCSGKTAALNIGVKAKKIKISNQFRILQEAILFSDIIGIDSNYVEIADLTLYAEKMLRISEISNVKVRKKMSIFAGSGFVYGTIHTSTGELNAQNLLHLAETSKLIITDDITVRGKIIDYKGSLSGTGSGTLDSFASTMQKFGQGSRTHSWKLVKLNGASIILDGAHLYTQYDVRASESLDLLQSTFMMTTSQEDSSLCSKNIALRGEISGRVAITGKVIVNSAKVVDGKLSLFAFDAAVNTKDSDTSAEEFTMQAGRVFAEGRMAIEGTCKFLSKTSTYLQDDLNLVANRVTIQGEGNAIITSKIESEKSVKSNHTGRVVIGRQSEISAAKKINHTANHISLSGKSDSKDIKVIAKSFAEVDKSFTCPEDAKVVVHSESNYLVSAQAKLEEITLSGVLGQVDKSASLDAKKAVFAGATAIVDGSVATDKLHISQETGTFIVAENGHVKYRKEMQTLAQDVLIQGQLSGQGDTTSFVKASSFNSTDTGSVCIDSPSYINATTSSLSGKSDFKNTVMTGEVIAINGRVGKGQLVLTGSSENAEVAIGKHAYVDNDRIIVNKIQRCDVAGTVKSKDIHIDVDETHISHSGQLGGDNSNLNGKMNTLMQLGNINGSMVNLNINWFYMQNALHGPATTKSKNLKITSPFYINLLGYRDANKVAINTLLPTDLGILRGNFIVANYFVNLPLPLLIIPNLLTLFHALKNICTDQESENNSNYTQLAAQTAIAFLRTTHPLLASVSSIGMNSYFLINSISQLSHHKILKGEKLTNAEWVEFLILIKNIVMSFYAIYNEANNSYEAVSKEVHDKWNDVSNYFTNHFLKDIQDIRAKAQHYGKHLYYAGRDYVKGFGHDHPDPIGVVRREFKDGKYYTATPYNAEDIENASLDHPGDKRIIDSSGRNCLYHDTTADITFTDHIREYVRHTLDELQDSAHMAKMDIEEYLSTINKTSLCQAFQEIMPIVSLFAPSVYVDSFINLNSFKGIVTGIYGQRSIFDISIFSKTFGLSESKQAVWLYDFNSPAVISANYRGHYVYIHNSYAVPIFSVAADKFEQGDGAYIDCHMQTTDVSDMKKYRIRATVNNFIYDTVQDEKAFLELGNQWKDYQAQRGDDFEVNYFTHHKLNLDRSFIAPWKVSYTATEINIPNAVVRGSRKEFILRSTKGNINSSAKLVGKKIIEDSSGKIVQEGGGIYTDELYQHAREGIDLAHTEVFAKLGYQSTDYNNISNIGSYVKFQRFGYVDAKRGSVTLLTDGHHKSRRVASISGGSGGDYSNVGLVAHGGKGVINNAGELGADVKSVIIGDDFIQGLAQKGHNDHIDRPSFYSKNHSVTLVSRYGSLDSTCGDYRGKEGIYFDLRGAPTFRGLNVHEKHHPIKILFGILPVSMGCVETDNTVSQQFITNGALTFDVKYGNLILPDSSIIAALFVTDVWSGECFFPQTPIYHHERSVSYTFGGNVAFVHYDYDESGRVYCTPPVLGSINSTKNANNNISKAAAVVDAVDDLAGLDHLLDPDIGAHSGIRLTEKRYQTPNHTQFFIGTWLDYSRGIHIGDVNGSIGALTMYSGNEFTVSGSYNTYDSSTTHVSAGISYHPLTQQVRPNASIASNTEHDGYWHNSQLRIGKAVFHQPVAVTLDQANVTFGSIDGRVSELNVISHADHHATNSGSMSYGGNGSVSISYAHSFDDTPTTHAVIQIDDAMNCSIGNVNNVGGLMCGEGMKTLKPEHTTQQALPTSSSQFAVSVARSNEGLESVSVTRQNEVSNIDGSKINKNRNSVNISIKKPNNILSRINGQTFFAQRHERAPNQQNLSLDQEDITIEHSAIDNLPNNWKKDGYSDLDIYSEDPTNRENGQEVSIEEPRAPRVPQSVSPKKPIQQSEISSYQYLPNNEKTDCFDDIEIYRAEVYQQKDVHAHHGLHPHLPILREWMHLAKYLTDVNHAYFKKELIVYRGDGRQPEEILADGFHAKGENPGILNHLNVKGTAAPEDSLYVSTSLSANSARHFPKYDIKNGASTSYVYKINAPESAFDIHAELKKIKLTDSEFFNYSIMQHEMEIVIPRHVPATDILGYYKVERFYYNGIIDVTMSDFIKNPSLSTKWYQGIVTGERVMFVGGVFCWGLAIGMEAYQFNNAWNQAVHEGTIDPVGNHVSGVVAGFPASAYFGTRAVMISVSALEAVGACSLAAVVVPMLAGGAASTAVYFAASEVGELSYHLRFHPATVKALENTRAMGMRFFKATAANQPFTNPLMYSPYGKQ